jgi:hypothetical protein
MNHTVLGLLLAAGLFLGILACLELGRRVGRRGIIPDRGESTAGLGAVEGAVFGLLGLMIAFTFSGATNRFDDRRRLITQEANAIGTAWLRLDLLPPDARAELRGLFARYLDSRLATYRHGAGEIEIAMVEYSRSAGLQEDIWTRAVAGCREAGAPPSACMLLLPALNDMIDITTTRLMATRMHPPPVVFGMLAALALASALLAGYGMAGREPRSWTHALGFAAVVAATVYIVIDIEYPRAGLIRVDASDEVLIDLRESMRAARP